jgi:hypothetical protein
LLVSGTKNFLPLNKLSEVKSIAARVWVPCILSFIFLVGGFYLLQNYRDNTRYIYYREHSDIHEIAKTFVNAWEFLDDPNEEKTVAMTMGWAPPGHRWFFYPLFGRRMQNDIAYISAKHKWDVPTRIDKGLLRGKDLSIWLFNLKRKGIDYILVAKPWPMEFYWLRYKDDFQLVLDDWDFKIFKYKRENRKDNSR